MNEPTTAGAASDPRRTIARLAVFLTTAWVAAQLWCVFFRGIDVDEFEHAHATWCVSRGLLLYSDFFEHHTPWLYLAFAPIVRRFATDTDPNAALSLLMVLRLWMWTAMGACLALVYALGRQWRDHRTGAIAMVLVATASQFVDQMIEFRPDVPALLCFLVSLAALTQAWRADSARDAAAGFTVSGLAFGAALLFTQKYVFALPGLAGALLAYAADTRARPSRRVRSGLVVLCAVALGAPIAVTAWWFATRGGLGAFIQFNLSTNLRLNAASFSPVPRLFKITIHTPALMLFGVCGFVAAVRQSREDRRRLVLLLSAASLFAGLFVFGRAYNQYMLMFFPHLAVFGASWAQDVMPRLGATLRARVPLTPVLYAMPPATLGALLLGVSER
ncbi:MAG: ArnT family glycosyltransferase, partial [Vicinamibacterales bacterium]